MLQKNLTLKQKHSELCAFMFHLFSPLGARSCNKRASQCIGLSPPFCYIYSCVLMDWTRAPRASQMMEISQINIHWETEDLSGSVRDVTPPPTALTYHICMLYSFTNICGFVFVVAANLTDLFTDWAEGVKYFIVVIKEQSNFSPFLSCMHTITPQRPTCLIWWQLSSSRYL